jgi:hypothetical protein
MSIEAFDAWLDDSKHILPRETFARLESTLGTLASTAGTVEPPN